jgi:hypothetical protein
MSSRDAGAELPFSLQIQCPANGIARMLSCELKESGFELKSISHIAGVSALIHVKSAAFDAIAVVRLE